MSESFWAVDPGETTGWSLWVMEPDLPIYRLDYGRILGGLDGVLDYAEQHFAGLRQGGAKILCERFNPALGTADGSKNYEPMYIEGALKAICRALGLEIIWQETGMKTLCTDDALKAAGLWIDNSEFDEGDARDVNDSQRHALAFAKSHDHEPSILRYWPMIEL